ncbi:MAG: DUF1573 domain-containing protein [Verrucomicrobiia bacterium]
MKTIVCIGLCLLSYTQIFAGLIWEKQEIEVSPTNLVQKVAVQFHFTNAGPDAITIQEIQTSCGCTTAALEKRHYEPKESGFVPVEFNVGTRTGFQQKTIIVKTDETNQPPTFLTFKIHLPEILKIEPNIVEWKRGETNSVKIIKLETTGIIPLKVTGVESSHEWIETTLKVKESGKFYEVEVKPWKTDEPIMGILRIRTISGTNSEMFSALAVRVIVN